MSKNRTKVALRRHMLNRWKEGRIKAMKPEPTDKEIEGFITGFNMGYIAHKTKRLK